MSRLLAAWIGSGIAACVMAFVVTGLVRRYALARHLLDQPGARRNHRVPTPRGGGLSIALVILCGYCVFGWEDPVTACHWGGFVVGLGLVAGIGWLDDHRPLSVRLRLCVHAFAAGLLTATVWAGGGAGSEMVLAFAAAMILTNVWNFMDGIDGLATTQAMIIAVCGLWLAGGTGSAGLLSLLVLAGCAGFLPWNFPKARIFLGDAGSGALGYSMAGLLVASMARGWQIAMLLLLPMAVFLVDAGCTLLARMARREPWWMAHSQHLYQLLVRGGRAHVRVTLAYAAGSAGCMVLAWYLAVLDPVSRMLGVIVVYAFAVMLWFRIRDSALHSSEENSR